jgi:hypothetical protein
MTRAAMLAALIVGTAMKFYREDLRKLYAADDHLAEAALNVFRPAAPASTPRGRRARRSP